MIGKMILPNLGGTPQVWNTCMVFFQAALLAGYAYTHTVSTRLKLQMQLIVHGVLLFLPFIVLFTGTFRAKTENWFPDPGANPIFFTLFLLVIVVGLPFFVVATSAPLLQKWFSYSGHPAARDPYFLYGASNIGSFASLLAYPFLIEWIMDLSNQSWLWTGGYVLLVIMVLACAGLVWKSPPTVDLPKKEEEPARTHQPLKDPKKETGFKAGSPKGKGKSTSFKKGGKQLGRKKGGKPSSFKKETPKEPSVPSITKTPSVALDDKVTPFRRLRWVALAAVPSSLMLGVTSYITTDLSPIPLLWLIPLMLYLVTFVLVFARWPIVWTDLPHKIMVWIQPFALVLLIIALAGGALLNSMLLTIAIHILAFFITTLVCHGELAKDRPSTKYLTEFYLLMSVGGVIGGMFNALIAPIFFKFVMEYSLAIFFACLLRPRVAEADWIDEIFNSLFGGGEGGGKEGEASPLARFLDIGLPLFVLIVAGGLAFGRDFLVDALTRNGYLFLAFGIPLVLCLFVMSRPIRFGLAIGAVLLVQGISGLQGENIIYRDRSYFGILQVKLAPSALIARNPDLYAPPYTTLIHGHINHGMCFRKPVDMEDWGNPKKDFSRLPTTYYHPKGPAGLVMQKYNWFGNQISYNPDPSDPGNWWRYKDNVHWADNRMPASLVAASAVTLGNLPTTTIVDLWSEPPFATIGLGTGTMAAYSRPFQHMHYYEIDNKVLQLSVRPSGNPKLAEAGWEAPYDDPPYFTYLLDAEQRGAEIWVFMGDARQRIKREYGWNSEEEIEKYNHHNPYGIMVIDGKEKNGGPENFYHMMVVDAFSSDAIPAHLITKEAIDMYFEKLVEEGILCVHTSNRYVDLVRVVADVSKELGLKCKRGHDSAPLDFPESLSGKTVSDSGHFTSEWVMVARKMEYLSDLEQFVPAEYYERERATKKKQGYRYLREDYWKVPTAYGRYVWTDNYYNVMGAMRELYPLE